MVYIPSIKPTFSYNQKAQSPIICFVTKPPEAFIKSSVPTISSVSQNLQ